MNNSTKIGLIGGIILVMGIMVWLFSGSPGGSGGQGARKPFVSSNWTKQYQVDDKKPLGLYLFTALTKAHIDTANTVEAVHDERFLDSIAASETPKTYMFVGNGFGLTDHEIDTVLRDVARNGSVLFLSFDDLTENLYERLFYSYSFKQDYDMEVNVFMNNRKYNMINIFQNDTIATKWWAFGELEFEEDHIRLSSFMEMTNFVRVNHGDGFIYLHATPNMFFNYQIKRPSGFGYTAEVLNELPRKNNVYLLEIGRLSDNYGNEDTSEMEGDDKKEENSYLKILFRDPMLRRAMLLAIIGLILFVIFRSKRKRPVVPFIEPKKDMTMAFAETITSIYFAKRNPYGLLQIQRKNFFDTIHRYFFVDLSRRDGDRELRILSEKSNTPIEEIAYLVNAYESKQAGQISEQFLAELAKRKHTFYRNVGIISDELNDTIQAQKMTFRRSMWLPALMILVGIAIIIVGMYLLVSGIGIGIVGWPLGILALALGIIRLSKPCLEVSGETITYYTVIGRKKTFKREELASTEARKSGVIFHFRNGKQLIINYWDLSYFDSKQFERLVSKLHTLEL